MIRLMNEKDIPAVIALITATFDRDPNFNDKQRAYMRSVTTSKRLSNSINQWYCVVYEDETTKRVIGFAGAAGTTISYMFVDPLEQGRGIGSKLINNLEDYMRRTQNRRNGKLFVDVYSTEYAVPFYEHYGFKVIDRMTQLHGGISFVRVKMAKYI